MFLDQVVGCMSVLKNADHLLKKNQKLEEENKSNTNDIEKLKTQLQMLNNTIHDMVISIFFCC